MMLSAQSFITDTLTAVDGVIGHYVQTVYLQLAVQYNSTLLLLCTLYILLLGYRFTMHTLSADFSTISRHLIVLCIVYGLITNWSLYYLFVYNLFTNEPGDIAQVMVNASNPLTSDQSIAQALNQVYSTGMDASKKLFNGGIRLFFCSIFIFVFTFVCCLTALGLLIYAKLAMAIALALGPIFLPFILWESTRGWFGSWLRKLFNFALIPIVTASILSLMLSVMELVLPDLNSQAAQGNPDFFTMGLFGGLSLVTAFLLKQSLPIASSLSGGLTLAALGQVGSMVSSTLRATGMNAAGRLAGKGIKAIGNVMANKAASQKKSTVNAAVEQGKK
ncbi:type IV secretion system protein [Rickettsiella endosymbiont of Miltochrista miniata]|uniref:type IV secretion system protein n=1 Tax=Rickettsiella endosymbiont of Miltochrista miniata TaxID=3066239 RepID=UPI00313D7C21